MQTFKRPHKKTKLRKCLKQFAADAIGTIDKQTDTFILSYGKFSLADAMTAILDQTGPADVTISTWTAANADLTKTASLMEAGNVESLRMIIDQSFVCREPEFLRYMISLFGPNCIRIIRTHAKFLIIRNAQWNIVVRTSMNLNGNPRMENLEITEDTEFADFFQQITDDIFNETTLNDGLQRELFPELQSVPESVFPLLKAGIISRNDINQVHTTHAIS